MWSILRTSLSSSKSSTSASYTTRTTSTSTTADETTCLLPHEHAPASPTTLPTHTRNPSTTTSSSATASLHQILTLHPHRIALLEQARAEDEALGIEREELSLEEHVLNRIDCIEIDMWHERIRDYEAAELGLVSAAELGLVRDEEGEEDGERLSRVQTFVDDAEGTSVTDFAQARRKRKGSGLSRFGSVELSLNHFHPYFWVDVLGICVLVVLVLGLGVYVGVEVRFSGRGVCREQDMAGAFWVAVQMLVGLGFGLLLQVPVKRWLVPFVLPVWVVGTFGVVMGCKMLAGCFGE